MVEKIEREKVLWKWNEKLARIRSALAEPRALKNQPMGHFIFDPLYWVCKKWADIWNVWCQSVFSSLFFLLRMTNSKLSMIWVTLAKAPSDASVTEDLWVCLVHQLILWNKNHEWSQTNGSKWKKFLFRLNAMNYNCTEFDKKIFSILERKSTFKRTKAWKGTQTTRRSKLVHFLIFHWLWLSLIKYPKLVNYFFEIV